MAGWLHGVFVGDWLFVFPLCGFSLSLFCNYFEDHGSARNYLGWRHLSARPGNKSLCSVCHAVYLFHDLIV